MMAYLAVQAKHLEKERGKGERCFLMLKTSLLFWAALAVAEVKALQPQAVAKIRSSL